MIDRQQQGADREAVGVPETGTVVKDVGTAAGQLDFQAWNIDLGEKSFATTNVIPAIVAGAADIVYHEARHAEQWHRMARIQAGTGKSAKTIATEMAIPKHVAEDAAADPLSGESKEATEGKAWLESVYGANAAHRNTVLTTLAAQGVELETKSAAARQAQQELQALDQDPQATAEAKAAATTACTTAEAEYETALTAFQATYAQYRALPEEQDAWATGGAVQAAYMK